MLYEKDTVSVCIALSDVWIIRIAHSELSYSAVKLTKCVYDLYVDNYKILIKKSKL